MRLLAIAANISSLFTNKEAWWRGRLKFFERTYVRGYSFHSGIKAQAFGKSRIPEDTGLESPVNRQAESLPYQLRLAFPSFCFGVRV